MMRILRKTSFLSILLLCGIFSTNAQVTKKITIVPAQYVTDSATFTTTTGWVYKSSLYDFKWEPTKQFNDKDSLAIVVKKEYPVGNPIYYIKPKNPVNKADSIREVKVLIEFLNPYKFESI